jgi:hypothetical protein
MSIILSDDHLVTGNVTDVSLALSKELGDTKEAPSQGIRASQADQAIARQKLVGFFTRKRDV